MAIYRLAEDNKTVKNTLGQPGGNTDLKVRLVADLSAAAFKNHQDKELALWYALRCLSSNSNGSGYIDLDVAIEGLRLAFGYSSRTISRTLARGEGQFWHRIYAARVPVIKLEGLESLLMGFGTQINNRARFREVPVDKFGSLKARRLALWASILKPKSCRANPIGRDTLTDITGLDRRRQQRYDKEGKVRRTYNCSPTEKIHIKTKTKEYDIPKRLPNTYHSPLTEGPKGMLPRVRRSLQSLPAGKGKENENEAFGKRRYFGSARSLLKQEYRVNPSYLLTRAHERLRKGRMEWEPILSMGVE